MSDFPSLSATAFAGTRRLAGGALADVALAVKAAQAREPGRPVLVFDDSTGAVVDLDLRGGEADIIARLAERSQTAGPEAAGAEAPARGRGRPRLGVVAREVTLLPRHWDWLAAQPGGASQALRRLVDEARRGDAGRTRTQAARAAAYRFLSTMAGDRPGFEEAIRALFADDRQRFAAEAAGWPEDIRAHAEALAWPGTAPAA